MCRRSSSYHPPLSASHRGQLRHLLLPLLLPGKVSHTFWGGYTSLLSTVASLVGSERTLFGVRRRQRGVHIVVVDSGSICASGFGIRRGLIVDTVSVRHSCNLIVGKLGQLLGDDGRSSLRDVSMGEKDIEFLEGSLDVSGEFTKFDERLTPVVSG